MQARTGSMRAAVYIERRAAGGTLSDAARRRGWIVSNFCFAAFLALILIGVAPFQEWVMTDQTGQGDIVNQVLHLGILFMLLFGSGGALRLRQLQPLPLSVVALLAYCLLTVTWAIDPMIALRRLILTSLVIWVLFRCVADLGYERVLLIMRGALIILLVLNFATVLFTPYGVHPALREESTVVGNWRGLMPHKNIAGAACAFMVILEIFDIRRFPKIISWAAIAGALIFLYFTVSKTSQAVLVFGIVGGVIVRPYSANYRTILGALVLIVAGFALQLGSVYLPVLTNLVNDPTSLTGRGAIWPLLIDYANQHPWTGAGFGSFWQIGSASPIWRITRSWVAQSSHGHNGYLDLLVTIGIPGLVLAVAALMAWPLVRLFLSLSISKQQRSLLFAMLAFCIGHNLTESSLLNGPSVVEVFLIVTIALIYRLADRGARARNLWWGRRLGDPLAFAGSGSAREASGMGVPPRQAALRDRNFEEC